MRFLHVNQIASRGGAAGVCIALHRALLKSKHESIVVVGCKTTPTIGVCEIDNDRYRSLWGRFWMRIARKLNTYSGRIRGAHRVSERWLPRVASPRRFISWWNGHEDFDFPGTRHLFDQIPYAPDIIHFHNLHGDYFDLTELPRLSQAVPAVLTLHDAWLIAGHCAHSFSCERWKIGCGDCPRLDIPPVLRRDGSAFNWQRKQAIFQTCRLSVVCPSVWLADKVSQSFLMAAITRLIVIPNGVDIRVFMPGEKAVARADLGWPQEVFIVSTAASGVRQNVWKDLATMRQALLLLGESASTLPVKFFAIGDTAPAEQIGNVTIEFVPYRDSLVECYQASDVYLHAATADTFPSVILEAMACGIPVVATAVGGIPEQIVEGETGFLVPVGNAFALAERLGQLRQAPELARSMGRAARQRVLEKFSLESMVAKYTQVYHQTLEQSTVTKDRHDGADRAISMSRQSVMKEGNIS